VTIATARFGDVATRFRAEARLVTMAELPSQLFLAILIGQLVGSSMARVWCSK